MIHFHSFPNSLTLVHEAMPWLPSVSLSILLPVGAVTDPKGFEGSAAVLSDWLHRGVGPYSSQEFSEALDQLGARWSSNAAKEFTSISASMLSTSLPEALELFADMLLRPSLLEAEFNSARSLAEQELASLADNPSQQLFDELSRSYFASGHRNSSYGNSAGLRALTATDLRQDFAQRVAPKGMIVSVAGGCNWSELRDLVERLFADFAGEGVVVPKVELQAARQKHMQQDTSQVQMGVAYAAVAPGESGWYENALAVNVLSGGMAARLFSEVREKRGLVYSVAAVSRAVRGFGYTLAYAGTTPERADETLEVLLAELRRLKEGVSAEELGRARTGVLSQLVMQGESSAARASALARDCYLLGQPRSIEQLKENLTSVSLNAVNRYLYEHYQPEFTVLTLGSRPLAEAVLS